MDETTTDPTEASVRFTSLPSSAVNRLAFAGLLVLAINELPAPQADLLDKSEELCNYIRKQQRPDGSLSFTDPGATRPRSTRKDPTPIRPWPCPV